MAGRAESAFEVLQRRLRTFESIDDPDAAEELTVVAIPSLDFDQDLLDAHSDELAVLEERWLFTVFALRRARVRVVVVTSRPVDERVIDYYLRLMPDAPDARARLELVSPDDPSPRPLAVKVLARPDVVARLRSLVPRRSRAFIMPFVVRQAEQDLAVALDVPIYGIDVRFAEHGLKSGGRRLFERCDVAHPIGSGGVTDAGELVDAVVALRGVAPGLGAAVVKLDDAVYGEGNRVLVLDGLPLAGTSGERAAVEGRVRRLGPDYLEKLAAGGVVEELVGGELRSPSVQLRVLPGGGPVVVSTHDQVLGGELGQTFMGCRFPADPAYATTLVQEARKVGRALAAEGAVGRFGVDFVVAPEDGGWAPHAVEINLREGGTSHPYGALWLLTDGSLDATGSTYRTARGAERHYFATDHLAGPGYEAIDLDGFLAASAARGLDWDARREVGAVYFMLRGLRDHGRIGVVAIGESREDADRLHLAVVGLLDELAGSAAVSDAGPR